MLPDPSLEAAPAGRGRLGSLWAYGLAVAITVFAVLSQYFLPQALPGLRFVYTSFLGGLFVVYGVPILAFFLLVGLRPLDRWAERLGSSLAPALGWYGALSLLGLGVAFLMIIVYVLIDPSALDLLSKPNPVVTEASSNVWFWVAFSFVIGAVEETIFRGWMFGYWIARGSRNLGLHALWTSAVFAGVHLYYGLTYRAVSPIAYSQLFLFGVALSMAVRAGRGNLVWAILLHGAFDATAFLQIVNPVASDAIHYGLILLGAAIALVLFVRSQAWRPTAGPPIAWTMPPPTAWAAHPGDPVQYTPPIPVVPPMRPPPPPR